jgi:hypothetical protein
VNLHDLLGLGKGLSKPLCRLIDVIAKGTGTFTSAHFTQKRTAAKADEIRRISDALGEVDTPGMEIHYKDGVLCMVKRNSDVSPSEPRDRIQARVEFVEQRRQRNIEEITSAAAAHLLDVEDLSDEPPDDDWIARFFAGAQDISNEQMQEVWARILAGEIQKPRTFSLRALELVRDLTAEESLLFGEAAKFAVKSSNNSFIHADEWIAQDRGLVDSKMFELGELGLVYPTKLSMTVFHAADNLNDRTHVLTCGDGGVVLIECPAGKSLGGFNIWKFSRIGEELLGLVKRDLDLEYMRRIADHFVRGGCTCHLGDRGRIKNGQVTYNRLDTISP